MKSYLYLLLGLLCGLCSCSECQIEESLSESQLNSVSSKEVLALIEQARWGDGMATKKLADCYREGRGMKKDFIGMMAMVGMSERQGGIDSMDAYFQSVPEEDGFRRMYDIINHLAKGCQEKADSIICQMDNRDNPDLDVLIGIDSMEKGDSIGGKQMIQAAITKGSSFGALILCFFESLNNPEHDMTSLLPLADEHPFIYKLLGDNYRKRLTNEAENEKLAAQYYLKADEYAMLSKGGASWLLAYYEDGGDIYLSDRDVKRLRTLADIESLSALDVDTVTTDNQPIKTIKQ